MMEDPFEILGLPSTADTDMVKTRWRFLAAEHHPDRGGDAVEFARYRQAYHEALEQAQQELECEVCGGTGRVVVRRGFDQMTLTCRACCGTGGRSR